MEPDVCAVCQSEDFLPQYHDEYTYQSALRARGLLVAYDYLHPDGQSGRITRLIIQILAITGGHFSQRNTSVHLLLRVLVLTCNHSGIAMYLAETEGY